MFGVLLKSSRINQTDPMMAVMMMMMVAVLVFLLLVKLGLSEHRES